MIFFHDVLHSKVNVLSEKVVLRIIEDKLVHVLCYDILGRYFGMKLRYFRMKIHYDF